MGKNHNALVKKIVFAEDIYYPANENSALVLGVSPDNAIHFSKSTEAGFKDTQLIIKNYEGRVLIPPNVYIDIPFIDRLVIGKVASPTRIGGGIGTIMLEIDPESNLELCVKTAGKCFINGELQSKKEYNLKEDRYIIGRKFETLAERFIMYISKGNNIMYNQGISSIREDELDHDIFDMNVCTRYNLVYINKEGGKIDVKYTEPAQVSGQFNIFYSMLEALRKSRSEIFDALQTGKPKVAQRIQEDSGYLRLNAERLNKVMQEHNQKSYR